jgi:hypothetical protein
MHPLSEVDLDPHIREVTVLPPFLKEVWGLSKR